MDSVTQREKHLKIGKKVSPRRKPINTPFTTLYEMYLENRVTKRMARVGFGKPSETVYTYVEEMDIMVFFSDL